MRSCSRGSVGQLSKHMKWLKIGKQRRAVAQVLRKPSTQLELLHLARSEAPNLQLGDVWGILREGIESGLLECLNPEEPTGKVFFYTELGREAAQQVFGLELALPHDQIDWNCYARVIRAKVRRLVLVQIAHNGPACVERNTASFLRKQLSHPHQLAIN